MGFRDDINKRRGLDIFIREEPGKHSGYPDVELERARQFHQSVVHVGDLAVSQGKKRVKIRVSLFPDQQVMLADSDETVV